jgi:hypothetical protein
LQGSYVLATDLLDQIRDRTVRESPSVQSIRTKAQMSQTQIEAKRSRTVYVKSSPDLSEPDQANNRSSLSEKIEPSTTYIRTHKADHSAKKSIKTVQKANSLSTCNSPTCDFSGFE